MSISDDGNSGKASASVFSDCAAPPRVRHATHTSIAIPAFTDEEDAGLHEIDSMFEHVAEVETAAAYHRQKNDASNNADCPHRSDARQINEDGSISDPQNTAHDADARAVQKNVPQTPPPFPKCTINGIAAAPRGTLTGMPAADLPEHTNAQMPKYNPAVPAFEGTNEIYIQSRNFDTLNGKQPAKRVSFGIPTSNAPTFEGTNEIYIRSSKFNALVDEASDNSEKQTVRPKHVPNFAKIPADMAVQRNNEESNPFGIINSGVLPRVEIDKSFEMPIVDENTINPSIEKTSTSKHIPIAQIDVHPASLPSPEFTFENGTGMPRSREEQHNFVIQHFCGCVSGYDAYDAAGLGCPADLDALGESLLNASAADAPQTYYLQSSCESGRERLVRAFLQRCMSDVSNFTVYADIHNSDGLKDDIISSLFSSRIGTFKNDSDLAKTELICSAVNEIMPPPDRQWAQNILFIRFGLEKLICLQKGLEFASLNACNDSDSLELLENMISRDASIGPTAVILSDIGESPASEWKDIYSHLSHIPTDNLLIILVGSKSPEELGLSIQAHPLHPLTPSVRTEIVREQLAAYHLPDNIIQALSNKGGSTLSRTGRIIHMFKRLSVLPELQDTMAEWIETIPDDEDEFAQFYFASYSEEACAYLAAACLLGQRYSENTLIQLLTFDPLADEIPGFQDRRAQWCRRIADDLCQSGDIVCMGKTDSGGNICEILDRTFFESVIARIYPKYAMRIHGCCANLLLQSGADDALAAAHYAQADMWEKASECFVRLANHAIDSFYTYTADALLNTCLEHIDFQHGKVYQNILAVRIRLNQHIGNFDEAKADADKLIRLGHISGDSDCSVKGFVAAGNALRALGLFSDARDQLLYSIQIAENSKNEDLICISYYTLARIVFESGGKGALVNALRYAEKALDISRRKENILEIAQIQTLCASIYFLRGEPERSKNAANEAYRALMFKGYWFDTPLALISLAESSAALGEGLPGDFIERGFDIVSRTGNIEHKFKLLEARLRLTITSLQRQTARESLDKMKVLLDRFPIRAWKMQYHLLCAAFDFSRKNLKKTTKSLRSFFDIAAQHGNLFSLSQGYLISADLNYEVFKRKLSPISVEKTQKLYINATSLFESIGAWHDVAAVLRHYADFLDTAGKPQDARQMRSRANKVDPYL